MESEIGGVAGGVGDAGRSSGAVGSGEDSGTRAIVGVAFWIRVRCSLRDGDNAGGTLAVKRNGGDGEGDVDAVLGVCGVAAAVAAVCGVFRDDISLLRIAVAHYTEHVLDVCVVPAGTSQIVGLQEGSGEHG